MRMGLLYFGIKVTGESGTFSLHFQTEMGVPFRNTELTVNVNILCRVRVY